MIFFARTSLWCPSNKTKKIATVCALKGHALRSRPLPATVNASLTDYISLYCTLFLMWWLKQNSGVGIPPNKFHSLSQVAPAVTNARNHRTDLDEVAEKCEIKTCAKSSDTC